MADFLWDHFDINVSNSTISKALTRARWSRGKIYDIAAERNDELRLDWKRRISKYQPRQLMFLDESAFSEKVSRCRTAWSLHGVAPRAQRRSHCRERFSILPTYTMDGIKTWRVIPRSFNSERFLDFVREMVIPICISGWTVLCLDNCGIHRSQVWFPIDINLY